MGCDILERVQKKCGSGWVDLGQDLIGGRSYKSFFVLAGVRDYYEGEKPKIIADCRGLPDDFDDRDGWAEDPDIHSTSWCTLKEILEHPDWDKEFTERGERGPLKEVASNLYKGAIYLRDEIGGDPADIRIVFGFDN